MWRLLQKVVVEPRRFADSALALLALSAAAQVGAQQSAIPSLEFNKPATVLIDPDERISGGARVGAAFEPDQQETDLDRLFVYFDRQPRGDLQVQLTSIDGRFIATFPEGAWEVKGAATAAGCGPDGSPGWRPANCDAGGNRLCGWVELAIDEKVTKHLSGRDHKHIAPLVLDEDKLAYPVRWGACGKPSYVRLYVNAEGARAFFVSGESTKDCTAASTTSAFKYDRICDVPIDSVTQDRIYILRKRGAGFSDPIEFDVVLPRVD